MLVVAALFLVPPPPQVDEVAVAALVLELVRRHLCAGSPPARCDLAEAPAATEPTKRGAPVSFRPSALRRLRVGRGEVLGREDKPRLPVGSASAATLLHGAEQEPARGPAAGASVDGFSGAREGC